MVEIAISVAAKVAEYLVVPIVRPFSYVWNYKTNFQNLETEVGKLKGKQDAVQHLVDDARRNGEDIEQHVNNWLDSVKKKVDEVSSEIIQEKGEQANMKCFNGLCPNPKKLYQHSRKVVRKAKSIVELQQEGNFQKVSYRTTPKEIWIPSYRGYEAFESRMSTLENILNALSNPDVNMLSIYGVGGIGKTTLARAVAKHAEDNKLFDVVAFAEVSAVPDVRKIQGEIADKLGLTFQEESISGRARKLRKCLKQDEQKKKILLVLDNIWATLELDEVGIPFGDDCKGCKVLLTARDLDALTLTGSQLNFSMNVLNDQEAWNLFSTTAGDCIEQKRDLQVLAEEVAKACGGLPIAIVTIAKALRNKKEFEWRNALQELKKPSPRTLKGVAGPTYSCIEFSYNQLKDEELESIFLLCSTMGSDSIGDLVKYGMGLRIFKGINRIKEARDLIDTLVRKLKDASLLLDTPNNGSFSMHDVVRDVGRLIASRNQHAAIVMDDNVRRDWDDDDTLKTSTRIFLHNISELPKELECQNLEFLYMQTKDYGALKIPDSFFTKMSKLRVLHLVGFDLSSLPTSLCLLVNLRTMCMDGCEVQDIALIGELKKLEILSIHGHMTFLRRLPKEVCKLTGLRLLDFGTGLSNIPPNIIASLTQLEELYLYKSNHRWEVQGGSNASLDELKCLPHLTVLEIKIPNTNVLSKGLFSKNLEMYNISIGQPSENYLLQLILPKTSRKLMLNLGDNCSCLEDVLHKTPSVKNVLSALDGGEGFPKLKQLWVHSSSCFRTVADCSESESYNPFPSLETLFLEKLNNLEKIYNGQFGAEFLCQFRNIKVKKCDKLKNIFSFSTIRALPLEEIEVGDCANITEIFAVGKEEDILHLKELRSVTLKRLPQLTSFCSINNNEVILEDIIDLKELHFMTLEGLSKLTSFCFINNNGVILEDTPTATFNGKVRFPNLETLKLDTIKSEQIWHNQLPTKPFSFQSLRELHVSRCHQLKYLFSSPTVVFPSLEKIAVSDMNDLEVIWHNQLAEDSFHSLKSVEVSNCNKLLTIFKFNMLERDPQRKLPFEKLNNVMIYNCQSLKSIFPAFIARNLSQLEQLNISVCGAMEKIVAEEEGADLEAVTRFDFPRLTSLVLIYLSQLRYFYPGRHTAEWPALNKLKIYDCDKIGLLASEENNEEGQLNILVQQPLFFVKKGCFLKLEEVQFDSLRLISQAQFSEHRIPKLKFLKVYNGGSVFPPDILWRFPNLEKLEFTFGSYEEIFSLEEFEKHAERPAQIKSLQLSGLEKLKHIWKQHSKLDLIFQKLEILDVQSCGLTDLLPPSAFFRNLKILHVGVCNKLTSILTSSTAESLVQLTEMKITGCDMLTEVVARDEGDVTKNKIIFPKLKTLILGRLSSFTNFCVENYTFEFPALEKLEVFDCNKLTSILTSSTAESLVQLIEMNITDCYMLTEVVARDEGDVTKNKIIFPKLKTLILGTLSSFTNFGVENYTFEFPALEKLEVFDCNKLTSILTSSTAESLVQLTEMVITSCDMLTEVVARDEGDVTKNKIIFPKLKTLKLLQLSSFTNFCVENYTFEFPALEILVVFLCNKLTSILTSSTAERLVQLPDMYITDCDMLTEVVARDEGDVTKNKIIFPKLKTLILSSLSSLTNFCFENYTFEFPALENLEVVDCNKMEIFCPGVLRTPKLNKVYYSHGNISWIWEGDLNATIQEMYKKRNKRTNAESLEEDGAGPSTQHQVLQSTESSEDGSGLSTQHLVLQNEERSEEDGVGPSTQHLERLCIPESRPVIPNAESLEEDGAGPSTQHQVLQSTESSEEDGSGLSTQHLVLQNEESSEEDGVGPSTQHLE